MKKIRNERGIALVTALLLTFLSLVIILALMYIVSQGTKVSGASKRYKSALEASYGGAEVFTKELIPQFLGGASASLTTILVGNSPSFGETACIQDKLNAAPGQWLNCGAAAKTMDPKSAFDAQFTLRGQAGQPNFNIYAKIVDTQQGNSDTSGEDMIGSGAGVAGINVAVAPKHMPATYRIEIQGERATNPLEKAKLSILYAY